MSDSGDMTEMTLERLYEIVQAHEPHEKSLLDEESKEAYNEEAARKDFGDQFINRLMNDQRDFKGDWWHLALLIQNLKWDEHNPLLKDDERLKAWHYWRYPNAHLASGDYVRIHLEHANLFRAHLEHVKLFKAHIEHATLLQANLEHADIRYAHLEHTVLGGANLEITDFTGSNLEYAKIHQANMDRAIVRGAKGLKFDRNRVEGIDIEGNAPDPWSVLRRKYTGPMFFCHLLLLIVFFIPYAVDVFYLSSVSKIQTWLVEEYDRVESKISDVKLLHQYNDELKRRIAEDMVETPAWYLLFGLHKGFWPVVFAVIVIIYNILRGVLTLRVSSLREAEERSHITPALDEYWKLFRCHQVAKYLWYAAILVVAFNTTHWLVTTTVYIPK